MKMLDVVRLNAPRPDLGLKAGEQGTIVEVFPAAFLVEFSDDEGQEYAMPWLAADEVTLVWSAPDTNVDPATSHSRRAG